MPGCRKLIALCIAGMEQPKFYSTLAFGRYQKPSFYYRLRAKGSRGRGVEPGLNELTILSPKFRISKM